MWWALWLLACRTDDSVGKAKHRPHDDPIPSDTAPAPAPVHTADTAPPGVPPWDGSCPDPDPATLRTEADLVHDRVYPCELSSPATLLCDQRSHVFGHRADLNGWRDELFLFLPPGPGHENIKLRRWALFAGYRTIVLGYVNDGSLTDACANTDGTCHADWREETTTGQDASEHLDIGPQDSIEGRLLALLQHLEEADPERTWGEFLTSDGDIAWDRIVVSGWSIGAGQAAWLAHTRPVAGALLFSGPKDRAEIGGVLRPAPWISEPVLVPGDALFGVYHIDEEGSGPPTDLLGPAWDSMGMPLHEHDRDAGIGTLQGAHRVRLSASMDGLPGGCNAHGSVGRDACMHDDQMELYVPLMCAVSDAR